MRLRNWNVDPRVDDGMFEFKAPAGATRLESLAVDELGEIAAGAQ